MALLNTLCLDACARIYLLSSVCVFLLTFVRLLEVFGRLLAMIKYHTLLRDDDSIRAVLNSPGQYLLNVVGIGRVRSASNFDGVLAAGGCKHAGGLKTSQQPSKEATSRRRTCRWIFRPLALSLRYVLHLNDYLILCCSICMSWRESLQGQRSCSTR